MTRSRSSTPAPACLRKTPHACSNAATAVPTPNIRWAAPGAPRGTRVRKPRGLGLEGDDGLVGDAPESAINVAVGNLIGNAVKYTTHGEVSVRLLDDAVEVVDSGPGLSAEDAARLFERGYRGTHAEHSLGGGIGLSIVRRLCRLYDWEVRVVPGEERGVVATLTFPVSDAE